MLGLEEVITLEVLMDYCCYEVYDDDGSRLIIRDCLVFSCV